MLIPERLDPEELGAAGEWAQARKLVRKDFGALAESLAIPGLVVDRTLTHLAKRARAWPEHIGRSFLPLDKQAELNTLEQERLQRLDLA